MRTLARVLVDSGALSLDREFYYTVPERFLPQLKQGSVVEVPFGHGKRVGLVLGFTSEQTDYELKDIYAVKSAEPLVGEKEIELAMYMQKRYIASLYECIKLLCPPGVLGKNETAALTRKYACLAVSPKEARAVLSKRATAQLAAVDALEKGAIALSECSAAGVSTDALRALEKKHLAVIYDEEKRRNPFSGKNVKSTKPLHPTEEQALVINELCALLCGEKSETVLLHGVTGSGKTEVYMQVIEKTLSLGKGALVLVPEISLTPQMTDRFLGRFGDNVAILHSRLSAGERLDEWNRIKNNRARVVIGARSAVFAPIDNLGIIIVDEEHENTYKSEQSPHYDAVEVAKKRCQQYGALLLLASATPSVNDYYRALSGEYRLMKLTKRCNGGRLPRVFVADMRRELKNGNRSMLSELLKNEIQKNIESGEQTVLFLNRRGFSTFVSCRDCGYVAMCPSCSIALTYHKSTESLNCHYCGHKIPVVKTCPECGSGHVKYFGTGTQRLEDEIKRLFPTCSVLRMDVDTTTGKNAHERILKKFSEEKVDILLGTQMVSKGLDFPKISLVGVVAADMSLNVDDYRASERTFDLITQVCGRAGRGNEFGRAVIQTYSPESSVIEMAKNQDYEAFYSSEIAFRQMFLYPPFSDIVCIGFSSENETSARDACKKIYTSFKNMNEGRDMALYEPAPAPLSKIKGQYRWRFWLKTKVDDTLRENLRELYAEFKDKNVRMTVAIDPVNMT